MDSQQFVKINRHLLHVAICEAAIAQFDEPT